MSEDEIKKEMEKLGRELTELEIRILRVLRKHGPMTRKQLEKVLGEEKGAEL